MIIPRMTQENTRRRTRALKERVRAGYLVIDTVQCSPVTRRSWLLRLYSIMQT